MAAVLIAFGCFSFFAFILPGYDSINKARELLSARQQRLDERTELIQKVATLKSQYDQNISSINKLDSLIPTNKHQDEIISSIQTIAVQSGLNLVEMNIADTPNLQNLNATYKSGIISMVITGQYDQFFNFLQLLEQSLRLFDVQNINASEATGGTPGAKPLNFEVKVNFNSLK